MARAPFIYKTRARINFYYADAATTTDTDTNTDPDAAAITATTAITTMFSAQIGHQKGQPLI